MPRIRRTSVEAGISSCPGGVGADGVGSASIAEPTLFGESSEMGVRVALSVWSSEGIGAAMLSAADAAIHWGFGKTRAQLFGIQHQAANSISVMKLSLMF
jgi:hypothetical protein